MRNVREMWFKKAHNNKKIRRAVDKRRHATSSKSVTVEIKSRRDSDNAKCYNARRSQIKYARTSHAFAGNNCGPWNTNCQFSH
jgi:hypothetical protein